MVEPLSSVTEERGGSDRERPGRAFRSRRDRNHRSVEDPGDRPLDPVPLRFTGGTGRGTPSRDSRGSSSSGPWCPFGTEGPGYEDGRPGPTVVSRRVPPVVPW